MRGGFQNKRNRHACLCLQKVKGGDESMDVEKVFRDADFSNETNFIKMLHIRLMSNFFAWEDDELDDYELDKVIAAKSDAYSLKSSGTQIF